MKRLLTLFTLFSALSASAQTGTNPNYMTTKSVIALNAGYEYFSYHGGELGLAYAKYSHSGRMSYGKGYGVSGVIIVDTVSAYGGKISGWMNGGSYHISLGGWVGFFMNENGNTLRICPQVGFGSKRWRVNYGYSYGVLNNDFKPANTHTISLNFLVDLHTLKSGELGADRNMKKKKKNTPGYQHIGD
jgi:hypothetical protein